MITPLLRRLFPKATMHCVCGHDRDLHDHNRHGSDCGLCDCTRYRGAK
ncbi:MAG: hypothetical protein H0X39_00165 [Actinobacteria bacterium]|nr:hypothetical protein [Actinomycetota bacterium]